MDPNQNYGYPPPQQQGQPPYPMMPQPYPNQQFGAPPYQQQPYYQQQQQAPIMMQPMQQQGYYNQQQQPVIMQQPTAGQPVVVNVIQQGPVGKHPQVVTCPNCKETVTSNVSSQANSNTHMTACFLCIIGFPCCCCLLPYCMDKCKSQKHECPRCGAYLGENNESSKEICCFAGIAAICCCMNDGGCCGDCDCEGCGDCGDCGDCFDD